MVEERRVEPGQKVRGSLASRTINTMIELVRLQRLQRLGPQGGEGVTADLSGGLEVLVWNQTGTFQPAGSVLSILQGTPLDPAGRPEEFLARPCFAGTVPAATTDTVAVLRDGVADGEVGAAVLRGLAVVALDVTNASHRFAVPVVGDESQMASADSGHPILWTATGTTGPQDAVVLIDPASDCCGDCESAVIEPTSVYVVGSDYVSLPLSEEVGSLSVVWLNYSGGGGNGVSPPDGWTVLYDSGFRWAGYRVCQAAGETKRFDITGSFAAMGNACWVSISNAVVEASGSATATSSTLTAPSVTSPGDGRRLLVLASTAAPYPTTAPAGMAEFGSNTGTDTVLMWEQDVQAGATGTRTLALSGSLFWVAVSVIVGGGEPATGTSWTGDSIVCGKIVSFGPGPAGTGPPSSGVGGSGSIYFDVTNPDDPQFYYRD